MTTESTSATESGAPASASAGTATLSVWYYTNKQPEDSSRPDRIGAHVGLLIEFGDDSAYLGWWPSYFRVDAERESLSMSVKDTILRFSRSTTGRRTACATKPAQADGLTGNDIDSVLVRGEVVPPGASYDAIEQRQAEAEYRWTLTPQQARAGIKHIRDFDESRPYHALRRNCATVCADALREVGVRFPWWFRLLPIVSPRLLWRACETKGHLGAERLLRGTAR